MKLLIALLLALMATGAHAQTTVIDGDSITISGTNYRIHGIDAPEWDQVCPDGWQAGAYATAVMRGLVDNRTVTCQRRAIDRYGRTIATCWVDGLDLGAEMVRQGMAWAKYSRDYALQEQHAKAAKLGVHGANCQPAWQYRQERR